MATARDEVVLVESFGAHALAHLHIGDPSRSRHYAQHFVLTHNGGRTVGTVFHGGTGDFDGDGDVDLLVSYYDRSGSSLAGYFALFVSQPSKPRQPALRRAF